MWRNDDLLMCSLHCISLLRPVRPFVCTSTLCDYLPLAPSLSPSSLSLWHINQVTGRLLLSWTRNRPANTHSWRLTITLSLSLSVAMVLCVNNTQPGSHGLFMSGFSVTGSRFPLTSVIILACLSPRCFFFFLKSVMGMFMFSCAGWILNYGVLCGQTCPLVLPWFQTT